MGALAGRSLAPYRARFPSLAGCTLADPSTRALDEVAVEMSACCWYVGARGRMRALADDTC